MLQFTTVFRQYRAVNCKDAGYGRIEVLQRNVRLDHSATGALRLDEGAFEALAMAAHARQLREQFQPMFGSLDDERLPVVAWLLIVGVHFERRFEGMTA
jgi:hypothetical protein